MKYSLRQRIILSHIKMLLYPYRYRWYIYRKILLIMPLEFKFKGLEEFLRQEVYSGVEVEYCKIKTPRVLIVWKWQFRVLFHMWVFILFGFLYLAFKGWGCHG